MKKIIIILALSLYFFSCGKISYGIEYDCIVGKVDNTFIKRIERGRQEINITFKNKCYNQGESYSAISPHDVEWTNTYYLSTITREEFNKIKDKKLKYFKTNYLKHPSFWCRYYENGASFPKLDWNFYANTINKSINQWEGRTIIIFKYSFLRWESRKDGASGNWLYRVQFIQDIDTGEILAEGEER
jgi:hypothetical protein